jgi:hypothetical protein
LWQEIPQHDLLSPTTRHRNNAAQQPAEWWRTICLSYAASQSVDLLYSDDLPALDISA